MPNGTGVFNVVTTTSDLTWTGGWNSQQFFVYLSPHNTLVIREVLLTESGASSTLTRQYRSWYDTTNNKVKWTDDTGATWTDGYSFPIALVSSDASSIISIDQIFNGFGYIGSAAFALPGVKCQFADGRNKDGTPKSFIKTLANVVTNTFSYQTETYKPQTLTIGNDLSLRHRGFAYTQNNQPYTTDACWFCPKDNKTYKTTHTAPLTVEKQVYEVVVVEKVETDSSFNIISFQPKTVPSINQYDMNVLSAMSMPSGASIKLTVGASGQTYVAPANGWFYICCTPTANGASYNLYETNGYGIMLSNLTANAGYKACMPIIAGHTLHFSYNNLDFTSYDFLGLWFYYASGDK